jgi:intracellular sulfur oxidation DsrE/DsrF family protein
MKSLAYDGGSGVEVVSHGAGRLTLKKSNTAFEERLEQLSKNGVKLMVCRNAMKNRNVKSKDLFAFAGQVDSGIAEMVRTHEAG